MWRLNWRESRRGAGKPAQEQFQQSWWLVWWVVLTGPQGVLIFCQTLLWGCLWGCLQMRSTMESVNGVKVSLPNVGGPPLTSWRPGQNQKAGPPVRKRKLLGEQAECWSFLVFGPELTLQLFLHLEPAGFWTETSTVPSTLPVLRPVDVDRTGAAPAALLGVRLADGQTVDFSGLTVTGAGAQCFTITAKEFGDFFDIERMESESAS